MTKLSLSAKIDDVANGTRAWIRASSRHSTTSTLLILAVCRTLVKYEPSVYMAFLLEFSVAQVDRGPSPPFRRSLGGHRF